MGDLKNPEYSNRQNINQKSSRNTSTGRNSRLVKCASENQNAARPNRNIEDSLLHDQSEADGNRQPVRGEEAERKLQEARQLTNANLVIPGPGHYAKEMIEFQNDVLGGAIGKQKRQESRSKKRIISREPGPNAYQPSIDYTRPNK